MEATRIFGTSSLIITILIGMGGSEDVQPVHDLNQTSDMPPTSDEISTPGWWFRLEQDPPVDDNVTMYDDYEEIPYGSTDLPPNTLNNTSLTDGHSNTDMPIPPPLPVGPPHAPPLPFKVGIPLNQTDKNTTNSSAMNASGVLEKRIKKIVYSAM